MQPDNFEYQKNLAKKFPKFLPFDASLAHLDHVDSFFTPLQTAIFFRDYWQSKYVEFSNHILRKNDAKPFEEQYNLAEKRVSKVKSGARLEISDFFSNIFDKNCPGFSTAIYLMETFYEFPSMFFENETDFVDTEQKNDTFVIKTDFVDSVANNDNFENLGDVAESQNKNGIFTNSGDLADSHTKNGCFSICGFFAFFHHKKGNFRIFTKRRFCNMQPSYYHIFARFDKTLPRVGPAGIKLCYGRGHRFSITLDLNNISRQGYA